MESAREVKKDEGPICESFRVSFMLLDSKYNFRLRLYVSKERFKGLFGIFVYPGQMLELE